jgi:heavy metal sensor kinase
MKTGFFSSIRFRAYLLYVVVLSLALFFHNALTYVGFRETLERKVDSLLAAKVQAVESTLRTYRDAQKKVEASAASDSNWFSDLFRSASNARALTDDPHEVLFRHLTRNPLSPDPTQPSIAIDLFDAQGRLVDSSSPGQNPADLPPDILRQLRDGHRVFYTPTLGEKSKRFSSRAMAARLHDSGGTPRFVQTRIPLRSVRQQLNWFILQMFLRSLVVIVLASGGGILLVRFTLRPVDRMTTTILGIKPDNLDQRLRVPETQDEIARLAETFNEMLARLERSFHSQRQIVQDISHELKTPLTIIRGQIEVALKKRRSPEEYEEILQSSLEEIQKVRRIVDNLLLLARFDSPGHAMAMKPVALKHLLEELVQEIRIQSQEKQIAVSLNTPREVTIRGNDVHLDRLFRNLLENAVKYNVTRGRIDVTLAEDRDNACVTVRDTGIGIAGGEIHKVFDRFYRVDQARSSREGFGLGLSIAKSIVDAHGGIIEAESAVGQGTTFRVYLPIAGAPAASFGN